MRRAALPVLLALAACRVDLNAGRVAVTGDDAGPAMADGGLVSDGPLALDALEAPSPADGPAEPGAPPPRDGTLEQAPPDRAPADALVESYFPLGVGHSWTYEVTGTAVPFTKVQSVEALAAVGGNGPERATMAFRMRTTKMARDSGLGDQTVSWQAWRGDQLVRYRELSYRAGTSEVRLEEHWKPPRIRLDVSPAFLQPGGRIVERFVEVKLVGGVAVEGERTAIWEVVSMDEEVTVRAGRFRALHLRVSGRASGGGKDYWFARGVGKVKEVGSQIEDLVSFFLVTRPPKG